ncbi:hypothetical protein K439DRAFT_1617191 [Ramaria rubella]|nr:hypothetical protein K439DRAFT_1617191 [Ramaria rubella]
MTVKHVSGAYGKLRVHTVFSPAHPWSILNRTGTVPRANVIDVSTCVKLPCNSGCTLSVIQCDQVKEQVLEGLVKLTTSALEKLKCVEFSDVCLPVNISALLCTMPPCQYTSAFGAHPLHGTVQLTPMQRSDE